jgi:hypothetical protein
MAQKRFKIITIFLFSLIFIILIFVFPKFPKPSQKPSFEEKKEIQPTQKIEEAKPTETTRIDISNWKTYRNEDFGFEIKYPPDYVFQQRTTAGSAIPIKFSGEFISQKDLNKKEEPRECEIPGIFIEIYDREDFGINENQTLEEFIMERCKKEQIGEEKICEKLKIGDYEWIKAEWPDMCPEENYYLEKNNLVYQFSSMTYEIEPILSAFKIFNIPLAKEKTQLIGGNILYKTSCNPRDLTCRFYSSFDGGKNWNLVKEQYKGGIAYDYDKKNPQIVYFADSGFNLMAGGECGFYKSTDGGKTFKDLTNKFPKSNGIRCFNVIRLDPNNSNIIYVYAEEYGYGSSVSFWKSVDGGNTWIEYVPDLSICDYCEGSCAASDNCPQADCDKDLCYLNVAEKTKDLSICDKIQNEYYKKTCYGLKK